MNFCAEPEISEILQCSYDFHFTPENGDRSDVDNVIILVVPDVTKFRANG